MIFRLYNNQRNYDIMDFQDLKIEDYPSFLKLYNEAFPENERRLMTKNIWPIS